MFADNKKRNQLLNKLLKIQKNKKRHGLTLIEIAMVLLVIAIIMGVVYANIDTGVIGKAQILSIKTSAQTIPILIEKYEFENISLNDGDSLKILTEKNPNNPGYRPSKKEAVTDPWGNFYFICRDEAGVKQVCSYGKDNAKGGEKENADFILTDESSWPQWLSTSKKAKE
jgi:prepilin-type N-terminal cleavage/methylation domain-containing protein